MAKQNTPREPHPARPRPPMRKLLKEFTQPGLVHPALIPGIGVESTRQDFRTNKLVFALSGALIVAVILWAVLAPDTVATLGGTALSWVTTNFGWMFGLLSIAIAVFMLVVGYSRTGGIRLGADDEKPEFSTVSWVAMLFSAGIGIGLLFYGPYEPLVYFQDPPYGFESAAGTPDAMHDAMAQTMLHWGPIAWAYYALVGGAIAYSAYRRGRPPLISSIFEPIFGARTHGPIGMAIDIFAILVTLFGTAISLGIGALQIGRGYQMVSGAGPVGNTFLIGSIAVLTVLFILSAVSGVKRGIRALSNLNMVLAGMLALFIFIVGPTLFILNFMPASMAAFFGELWTMLMRNPNQSPEAAEFMGGWTTYYWAWWVTWTPFVGLFIAKISRGRTLREFVTVVIIVPALVCFFWFSIFGGTSMWMELTGQGISDAGSPEAMLFAVLDQLPGGTVLSIIAMASIIVFFVTSADSASIVMASMSQRGRPEPSRWVTVVWGLLLGLTAASLLLAGGAEGLAGLQSLMVVSALPFAFVVMGIMIAWWRDLRTDPYILRVKFAHAAIAQGIRRGIEDFGDDFVFNATEVRKEEGAGAGLGTKDPLLTDWYLQATGEIDLVNPADIASSRQPGAIQRERQAEPTPTASADASLSVGEK
ncbi:choline transporter [Arthrobacter sp. MYb229]|uniref:BCCT family transporter n=1 Tax=unclassified Arthrobacter TaxID=235627 RepID=UPI000CFB3471|nr:MULTISPECIES: BCCT family transporter [unclassified Arthrobacter]PRA00043.1 choline transporter [Arthrobacter sp. MYb229]PRB48283.1 choline transporter [Arthrobacter sp. MYb216]